MPVERFDRGTQLRQLRDFGCHFQIDQSVLQHRRYKAQTHPVLFFLQGDGIADAPLRYRDVDFSTGQKRAFLTTDGRDGGLGQNFDQTLFHFCRQGDGGHAIGPGSGQGCGTTGQKLRKQRHRGAARRSGEVDVNPQFIEQRSRHFGHLDFEHDLLRTLNTQHVDDFFTPRISFCQTHNPVCFDGIWNSPAQHHRVGHHIDHEGLGGRHPFGESGLKHPCVQPDDHIAQGGFAVGRPNDQIADAGFFAQHINLFGIDQGDIGHIGVANGDAQCGFGKPQQYGLTTAQVDAGQQLDRTLCDQRFL